MRRRAPKFTMVCRHEFHKPPTEIILTFCQMPKGVPRLKLCLTPRERARRHRNMTLAIYKEVSYLEIQSNCVPLNIFPASPAQIFYLWARQQLLLRSTHDVDDGQGATFPLRRRRRREKPDPNRFPKVPSEKGDRKSVV